MNREFIVYALSDPREQNIFHYIGMSGNGLDRPKSHSKESSLKQDGNVEKVKWIRGLLAENLKPAITILERGHEFYDTYDIEQRLIEEYKALGHPIKNLTDGGPGALGHKHTDEVKRRLSQLKSGIKQSDEHKRNGRDARIASEKWQVAIHKPRISSIKGLKRSEEFGAAVSKAKKGIPLTVEHKKALKKAWAIRKEKGYVLSPETKIKMSAAKTGRLVSPETREAISKARLGIKFSANHIENIKANHWMKSGKFSPEEIKAKMKRTPEVIAKMAKSHAGKKLSQEHIEKLRASHLGKKLSEETKLKMRTSHAGTGFSSEQAVKNWEIRRAKYGPGGHKESRKGVARPDAVRAAISEGHKASFERRAKPCIACAKQPTVTTSGICKYCAVANDVSKPFCTCCDKNRRCCSDFGMCYPCHRRIKKLEAKAAKTASTGT